MKLLLAVGKKKEKNSVLIHAHIFWQYRTARPAHTAKIMHAPVHYIGSYLITGVSGSVGV